MAETPTDPILLRCTYVHVNIVVVKQETIIKKCLGDCQTYCVSAQDAGTTVHDPWRVHERCTDVDVRIGQGSPGVLHAV